MNWDSRTRTAQTSAESQRPRRIKWHLRAEEKPNQRNPATQRVTLEDGSYIEFAENFKYLSDVVSWTLYDDFAIRARIEKAKQAMGMLKPLFNNDHVDLWSKYQFFQALVVNALLWGCESWAIREQLYNEMDVFLHTSIRTILYINMFQVEE